MDVYALRLLGVNMTGISQNEITNCRTHVCRSILKLRDVTLM